MPYYTPDQEKQVQEFVDRYIELISWLKEPDGLDMLADKGTELKTDRISEEYLTQLFILFAMDTFKDIGVEGEQLYNRIAGAVLIWSRQSFDQEDRDALRPIFEKYLNT
jgi:hypothetical protein